MAAGPTAAPVFAVPHGRVARRRAANAGRHAGRPGAVARPPRLRPQLPARRHPRQPRPATGVITAEQVAAVHAWWLATTVDLHHVVGLSLVVIAALRTRVQPGLALARRSPARSCFIAPRVRTFIFGTPAPRRAADAVPRLGARTSTTRSCPGWPTRWCGAVFGAIDGASADRAGLCRRGALVGSGAPGRRPRPRSSSQRPGFDVFTYWRMPLSFAVAIFGIILRLAGHVRPRDPAAMDRPPARGSSTAGATASSRSTSRTGSSSAGASASSGSGDLPLGAVLLAMAAAVVATHWFSKVAVKLESSWWVRRDPTGTRERHSEVAVEIHRPAEPV